MSKKKQDQPGLMADSQDDSQDTYGGATNPIGDTSARTKAPPLLPQERWRKLAPRRLACAVKALYAVGNMGAKASYQASDAAKEYVVGKLVEALNATILRLRGNKVAAEKIQIPD